ncbi:MAG TPA: MiaB/RimO family radical SAM methylthiotransferase [Solirubrobacteraceae bacterium]|nr:MiaB/RimO family radical SAM methylthiotransferase [Solirubrobacteraceae bacterium]
MDNTVLGGTVSDAMAAFAVKFLGCKVSQADAMLARAALLEAGHTEAPESDADLHVINTCCITSEAESKSRQSARRSLKHAERVLVAGCAVNLHAPHFDEIDERVTPLVGTADEVANRIATQPLDALGGACADTEHDVLWRRTAADGGSGRTRGFVKVQDGCDCHCAYCIIPTVRGSARSRPASAILDEVARRVAAGQPEMVMTGISVGDYRDPERGLELGDLMCEVARVPGVQRVRLSSVEVIHVKDSLLRALTDEPKVCPHLHVPMQSGDDAVLRDMGRHYDAGEYLDHVARLRKAAGGRVQINLTTDVIVGFPSEDEAAFQRTLDAVDKAQITRVHVFPYSPRPGTKAAELGDRVAPQEKKRRSQVLRGRSEVRSRLHRAAKLGERQTVLVDKVADTQCSGYTADYTRCYLPAGAGTRGELVDVTALALHADGIRCAAV